jgi:hypothetical protein
VQRDGATEPDLDVIGMRPENQEVDGVRRRHTDR